MGTIWWIILSLQRTRSEHSTPQRQQLREPMVIILDGLNECGEEDTQLEIVSMITEAIRLKQDLPLLWLICSRPEAHLKYAFSRIVDYGRKELIINAECRSDVEQYLRVGIAKIKAEYYDITPTSWPSKGHLRRLIHAASMIHDWVIFTDSCYRSSLIRLCARNHAIISIYGSSDI